MKHKFIPLALISLLTLHNYDAEASVWLTIDAQPTVTYPVYNEPYYPHADRIITLVQSLMLEEPLPCKHVTTTVYRKNKSSLYYLQTICWISDGWYYIDIGE